ncbi:MAG: diaminopimelate decarboxylase [Deltaproteobacteria bacterium RIFCSPLOWO2_02_FULL_53_8]|nr:MAG: diaminopimelate decarboxylase [Deltaproteobacteria bacterium RIFCSPLOWO2_02_FULL_53_8]
MHYFAYKSKRLCAEGVPLEKIATEVGTPVYVYSEKTLKRHYKAFDSAFSKAKRMICYSVKANSNLAILKTFSDMGSGFDIVSGGELYRALKVGADPSRIVFSGVGKRSDEIEYAVKSKILMFNVESGQELRVIDAIAGRLKKKAGIAIRVNPNVDPKTHPYISTGLKKNKFGIETKEAVKEYVYAHTALKNVVPMGVDCHIGSQITEITPFVDALAKTRALISTLRGEGLEIKYLDMGGGLGITYDKEEPPHPSKYGEAVLEGTKGLGVTLIFEPGRNMVGNAGILVTRVVYTKKGSEKNFVIVDAGMNDLARPSLYGSYHAIKPVKDFGRHEMTVDVVGPICESGDFLAKDRIIPEVEPGELLAVMSAGAYGFSMSSNYNTRPRAAEVMASGSGFSVIRKREAVSDLIKGERFAGAKGSKSK